MFGWFTTQNSGTGAIDVIAVRDSTGNISCSPFHVKLNRAGRRGDPNRIVNLAVNAKDVSLSMKLGAAGEVFFVERTRERFLRSGSPVASLAEGSPTTVPTNVAAVVSDKVAESDPIPKPPASPAPTAATTCPSPMNVPDNLSIISDKR